MIQINPRAANCLALGIMPMVTKNVNTHSNFLFPMPRKQSRRVSIKNVNFKTPEALKAHTERSLRKHKEMDGRLSTFLNDCMRQFTIQMRSVDSVPLYPLEFVTKKIEAAPEGEIKKA